MFHACRIPQETQDCFRIYDPSLFSHAVVACRSHFFTVPVLDDKGDILPLSLMEKNLMKCQEMAERSPAQFELGYLTTWNRDDWSLARKELLRMGGPIMQRALEIMESSMLMICLDDEEPVSYRQRALEFWHGGRQSGGNRWFDKSIQLVASRNGKIGYVGEHSMMDGMPAVGLCDYLKSQTYRKQLNSEKGATFVASPDSIANIFQEALSNLSDSDRSELESLIDRGEYQ
jgi:carnitine O-acetyltransferase